MSDTPAPVYISDTHSLIWYLIDSPVLSTLANKCFRDVEEGKARLLIPAIVMAEIIDIVEKGKAEVDLNDLFKRIQEAKNFEISPLGLSQLLYFKEQTRIDEMHDRLIVCEALLNRAGIITKDKKIRDSGLVETLW